MLTGAVAMGFCVAGLFFLRFWRETKDRLFGFFALAFFLLAGNRAAFAFHEQDKGDYLYWVRFLAFAIILLAILDKNRSRKPPPARTPPAGSRQEPSHSARRMNHAEQDAY
jgi:hypothetical protein